MDTEGRREPQVPLPRVVTLQRSVREYAGRADFDQVAGEFVFENSIPVASEVDQVPQRESVEIRASGVLPIEPHAPVALNATVHLVIQKRAEILISERPLGEPVAAVVMPRHDRHVLQVALSAFVANRAIMRMVEHQAFDDARAKCRGFLDL